MAESINIDVPIFAAAVALPFVVTLAFVPAGAFGMSILTCTVPFTDWSIFAASWPRYAASPSASRMP